MFFLFFSLSFFLSLTFSFRLIPWSIEAPCVQLSARISKTWTGRRSASSLPRETGRAPVASVNRANSLSRSFIGFLCKPRNISLFLSSIPLSFIHSFIYSPTPFLLWVSLDPAGAGPRQITFPQANLFLPFLIANYSATSLDNPHFPSGNRSDCCYFKSSFICSLLCILYSHTDRLSDWETGLLSAASPINLLGKELLCKLSYSVFQMECLRNSFRKKISFGYL